MAYLFSLLLFQQASVAYLVSLLLFEQVNMAYLICLPVSTFRNYFIFSWIYVIYFCYAKCTVKLNILVSGN